MIYKRRKTQSKAGSSQELLEIKRQIRLERRNRRDAIKILRLRGFCFICGITQDKLKRGLCVDHDHKTGKIRGLLCSPCNFILGFAKDEIEILTNAVAYLNGFRR